MSGVNAVELSRRLQPVQMYFVEDVLPPEQIAWYCNIRQVCSTPPAIGEVFAAPATFPVRWRRPGRLNSRSSDPP